MARWIPEKHTYIPVDLTWAMTVFAFDHLSSAFVLSHWSKEEVALSIRSCFLPERLWWVPHSSLKPVRICLSLSTVLSLILCRIACRQLRKKGMKWELQRTSKSDQDSVLPMSQRVSSRKTMIWRKKAPQARVLVVECKLPRIVTKDISWPNNAHDYVILDHHIIFGSSMSDTEENLTTEQQETKDQADREREAAEQAGNLLIVFLTSHLHLWLSYLSITISVETRTRGGRDKYTSSSRNKRKRLVCDNPEDKA